MIELEYHTDKLELKIRENEKILYRGAFDLRSARRNRPVGYSISADGVVRDITYTQVSRRYQRQLTRSLSFMSCLIVVFDEFCFL